MTVGRKQYDLKPFFYAPLHDVAAVRYRHEVLRDLEKPAVLESVMRFAETMQRMREHLAQAEKIYYPIQREPLPTSYGEDSYRRIFGAGEATSATVADTRR